IALGVELEVVDERLHRGLHQLAARRKHLAVGANGPRRHFPEALASNLPALPHFLDPNHEAIVAVAVGADRNLEVHALIDFIWLRAAEIPRDSRGTNHRPGEAPRDSVVAVDDPNVDVA